MNFNPSRSGNRTFSWKLGSMTDLFMAWLQIILQVTSSSLLDNCYTNVIWTHWGRDKMGDIFQMTFWNAFSWMKMYKFGLKFYWSLFLRLELTWSLFLRWELTYSSIGSDNGLAPTRQATNHYLNQLDESTARRQLKSPRSLSGRSLHLTLVTKWSRSHMTLKIQISRSWPRSNPLSNLRPRVQNDMFAFRFVAIGPFLAEI